MGWLLVGWLVEQLTSQMLLLLLLLLCGIIKLEKKQIQVEKDYKNEVYELLGYYFYLWY